MPSAGARSYVWPWWPTKSTNTHPPSHIQVLDNAVENNEIYVTLCESVQTLEPQLQRLHGLLTNLRALLVKLREAATSTVVDNTADMGSSKGLSSSMSKEIGNRRLRMGGKFNLDPPELAPVLPVHTCFSFAILKFLICAQSPCDDTGVFSVVSR
jgi:hypothetical protein